MANTNVPEEVQVLRFFETAAIDRVEAVFNIVADKMRERLKGRQAPKVSPARIAGSRKPRLREHAETPVEDGHASGETKT